VSRPDTKSSRELPKLEEIKSLAIIVAEKYRFEKKEGFLI